MNFPVGTVLAFLLSLSVISYTQYQRTLVKESDTSYSLRGISFIISDAVTSRKHQLQTEMNFIDEHKSDKNNNNSMQNNGNPPLSIITLGCSGSSALIKFSREVLTAHGINMANGDQEILYPHYNRYWDTAVNKLIDEGYATPDDIAERAIPQDLHATEDYPYFDKVIVEAVNQTISSHGNKTLLFKSKPPNILQVRNCTVAKALNTLGVKFAYFYRHNILDYAVCMARDCFNSRRQYGYPVFATNGTRTDLCFKRRTSDIKVKAHMNVHNLVEYIHDGESSQRRSIEVLRNFTHAGQAFVNEELYAYEYTSDEDIFVKSLQLWTKLLSFATDIDESILTRLMKKYQNKLQLRPHSDVIANIHEVTSVLKDAGLDHYLRS